jgi:hypothetical protein
MIAMAINGVPAFGPQEADSNNAVLMTMAFRELDSGMLVTLLEVQPGMFTIPKWGKKQFHPTSFLVMPWMGFQSMALVTMTRLNDFDNILLIKNVNMPEFKSKKHEIINTKRKKDL